MEKSQGNIAIQHRGSHGTHISDVNCTGLQEENFSALEQSPNDVLTKKCGGLRDLERSTRIDAYTE